MITKMVTAQEVVNIAVENAKNYKVSQVNESYILAIQYDFIRSVLGLKLYNEILSQIESDSVSDANDVLLTNYIKPCIAFFVKEKLILEGVLFMTNLGTQKRESENSNAITPQEIALKTKAAKDAAESFRKQLGDYLIENSVDYPLFGLEDTDKGNRKTVGGVLVGSRKYRQDNRPYYNR